MNIPTTIAIIAVIGLLSFLFQNDILIFVTGAILFVFIILSFCSAFNEIMEEEQKNINTSKIKYETVIKYDDKNTIRKVNIEKEKITYYELNEEYEFEYKYIYFNSNKKIKIIVDSSLDEEYVEYKEDMIIFYLKEIKKEENKIITGGN